MKITNTLSKGSRALALVAALVVAFAGCASQQKKPATNQPAEPSKAPAQASTAGGTATGSGWETATLYLPTGMKETSAVMLTKSSPMEVTLGQPFEYVLTATNLTGEKLTGVAVSDTLPQGLEIMDANPKAANAGGKPTWNIGEMAPGSSKEIRVKAVATAKGSHRFCAEIVYNQLACVTVNVVEPALKLQKTMTPAVLTCDPIEVNLTVTNGGTGTARNVVVRDTLPAGMTTADGQQAFSATVGNLAAGESKTLRYTAKVSKTGEFVNNAVATADGGLEAKASAKTMATKPALSITKTGPDKVVAGRNVTYKIEVKNTGNGDARDAYIEDTLPAGCAYVSSTPAGQAAGGTVRWALGTLKAGEGRSAEVTVKCDAYGMIENTARAGAYCADAVAATAKTSVLGVPGLLLEVIDNEDPIEVGKNVTYIIRVTNQGRVRITNVVVNCTLDGNMEFVSAEGQTAAAKTGATPTFAPMAVLEPKAMAEWRVTVKATKEAQAAFKVTMVSTEITRGHEEFEGTNFYK